MLKYDVPPNLKWNETKIHTTTEKRNCPKNIIKSIDKKDVKHDLQGVYHFKDLLNFVKTNPNCIDFPPEYNQEENIDLAFRLLSNHDSIDFIHDVSDTKLPKDNLLFLISDDLDKVKLIEELSSNHAILVDLL